MIAQTVSSVEEIPALLKATAPTASHLISAPAYRRADGGSMMLLATSPDSLCAIAFGGSAERPELDGLLNYLWHLQPGVTPEPGFVQTNLNGFTKSVGPSFFIHEIFNNEVRFAGGFERLFPGEKARLLKAAVG